MNDAIAIEMEGWGASWTAHSHGLPVLVVRGISDSLDDKDQIHDAKFQPLAAEAASAAAFQILADFIALNEKD